MRKQKYDKEEKRKYYKDNEEHIKEYQKQYRLINKEKLKQQTKKYSEQYRKENKDLIKERSILYRNKNREEILKKQKEYRNTHQEKFKQQTRNADFKKKYGITIEDYNKMFDLQKGKCAICGSHQDNLKFVLCVDHDHTTGKVRGLLCHNCNAGIGNLKDNIDLLSKAIEYLKINL